MTDTTPTHGYPQPEVKMNHSLDPEGSGYHVELGDQRFTQHQWELIQLYVEGNMRARDFEASEALQVQVNKLIDNLSYAGPLRELVFTAVGAASTCWLGGTGDAVFDEEQAVSVANTLLSALFPFLQQGGHKAQRQVRAFHAGMGQPIGVGPRALPADRVAVRIELIREEFIDELVPALGARMLTQDTFTTGGYQDVVEVADAAIDILYVVYGLLVEMGIDAEPLFDEVQRSNMSKFGADGKAIIAGPNDPDGIFEGRVKKGPNYFKPDLARLLNEQALSADRAEDPLAYPC